MTTLMLAVATGLGLQTGQARLEGVIRVAESGAAIAGAVVRLVDQGLSVRSDGDGRYELVGVPAGPQHVTVEAFGYAPRTLHVLAPRRGTLRLHVALESRAIPLAGIRVRPGPAMRGSEPGIDPLSPDRALAIGAVRDHPLLPEPDVFEALVGGEVFVEPEVPNGIHVRGGASDHTAYLLDEIPVFSPYHAIGLFSAWNPDAVERIGLDATAPAPGRPHALSGVIAAWTRVPGAAVRGQGSLGTQQVRATFDGPLPWRDGGFLLSLRSGFPGFFAPRGEGSYLQGETGDGVAKVSVPLAGGTLRLLGYQSENEVDAASDVSPTDGAPVPFRNRFAWSSRSLGIAWDRSRGRATIRARAWRASSEAQAAWPALGREPLGLTSGRLDFGFLVEAERSGGFGKLVLGARLERSASDYDAGSLRRATAMMLVTPFVSVERTFDTRLEVGGGLGLAVALGALHPTPRFHVGWSPRPGLGFTAAYARSHQFAQSLSNTESLVRVLFPADLFVGADDRSGVPVAHADQVVLSGSIRPVPGMRIGLQAFRRWMDGLVLVAPASEDPFGTSTFRTGQGGAQGVALEAAYGASQLGLTMSYGWQNVRFDYGDAGFVPGHGPSHRFEAGAIAFPTVTTSVRAGVVAAFGRRGPSSVGRVEWESCNLLDLGCEFGGSPRLDPETLGATDLPPYVRLDFSLQKHWHLSLRGHDARLGIFAAVTNVLGRGNVLAYLRDPETGRVTPLAMRPFAPLVVGLDWRF